jgi:hypothetical protein
MYKLVLESDPNDTTELESSTFDLAVEESLYCLQWYVVDEGDCFVAINDNDSNETFALSEQSFEDAQYEAITKLGYYLTETNE